MKTLRLALLTVLVAAPSLQAQFGDSWVQFVRDDSMISSPSPISDGDNETDMAWADLDKDGDIDLVVVRAIPFINIGKRTNVLLMNEGGVLVDRTADLASASLSPTDQGFLTPTQDRDVVIADLDNDTWLDVITCTDMPVPGDRKVVAHPRIYMNLGEDGNGDWLGLQHEDARFPQILTLGGGVPMNPRFLSVSAGDVDDDGFVDLYFGDSDFVGVFVPEPGAEDTEDRLMINDQTGNFSDGTTAAMAPAVYSSVICLKTVLEDFNGDGFLDRLKVNGHFVGVQLAYNDPLAPGTFPTTDLLAAGGAPYNMNSGELNGDGLPDIVTSNNSQDRFLINTGNDGNDEVIWSAALTYEFLSGADDGFAANSLVADIDQDGWGDVLIADVDPEIPGYTRRMHIYHNRGGTVGGTDIVLREERQSASDTHWIGVAGMNADDLRGTHDVAVFDVDGDGLQDLIVSQLAGTFVWRQYDPWSDLGNGLAGTHGIPDFSGTGPLQADTGLTLSLSNALESATAHICWGLSALNAPFFGGTLVPDIIAPGGGFVTLGTNASGELNFNATWPSGIPAGLELIMQYWIEDPAGIADFAASNAIKGTTP